MLTIVPMNAENQRYLNQVDARFLAGSRVQLKVTRLGFLTDYVPIPTAEWRSVKPYTPEGESWLSDPSLACYLAFVDGTLAGQSVVCKGQNRLCDVLDIRTDSRFRRQGVGMQLIHTCIEWAQRKGFAGMRAELTDELPLACQFMEGIGFTLGGVDKLLHAAQPDQQRRVPATRETVLAFYRFF